MNSIIARESERLNQFANNNNSNVTTVHVPPYTNVTLRDAIIHFMDTHPISDPIHIVIG